MSQIRAHLLVATQHSYIALPNMIVTLVILSLFAGYNPYCNNKVKKHKSATR